MPLAQLGDMTRKSQTWPTYMTPAQALDPAARTSSSRPAIELHHSLPSQIAAIAPSIDLVMRFVSKFRSPDGSEANIEMALHEALANAVVHGNREDRNKQVHVICRCNIDGEVSVTIRDQGQGFDSRALADPTAPENLFCTHGRGIYLMRALMDEVSFDEGGVVVRMRKDSNADPSTQRRSR